MKQSYSFPRTKSHRCSLIILIAHYLLRFLTNFASVFFHDKVSNFMRETHSQVDINVGLTDNQVEASRSKHGENLLTPPKKTSLWSLYLRSEEHTSELQSRQYLVCRLLLEKKNTSPRPPRTSHHARLRRADSSRRSSRAWRRPLSDLMTKRMAEIGRAHD